MKRFCTVKSASSSESQLSAGKSWAPWNFYQENLCGMCVHARGGVGGCDPVLAWCKEGAFGVEEVAFPLGQKLDWFEFGFKKVEGTSPVPTPEKVLQLKEEAIKGFGCFGGFPPRFRF